MSNLGAYQEFVTAAARMGGVENMIRTIESGAVAKAAPALLGKGAGIGALITLAAGGGIYFGGRRLWSMYVARADAAEAAKEQLRAVLDVDGQEHADDSRGGVDESTPDADTRQAK